MTTDRPLFVFDVESIGLYGPAFAVGWVVLDTDGQEISTGYLGCDPAFVPGAKCDREWIAENVLPHLPPPNCGARWAVIGDFSAFLKKWLGRGALVAADCAYPVETNFLGECRHGNGDTLMPYPLIDVSSVLLALGADPTGTYPRRENELPAHHPTNDARQSARLLYDALAELEVRALQAVDNGSHWTAITGQPK